MKVLLLAPLGLVVLLVLLVLSPLVLVYLLFDRFCCLIEDLAPIRNRKHTSAGGGRLGMLKKLFSALPNVSNPTPARGLLPYQRPF